MKVALVKVEGSYQEAVEKVKQYAQDGVVALIVEGRHTDEITQQLSSHRMVPEPLE